MTATYTVEELLAQLDRAEQDYRFPCFDVTNFSHAGARLHAYRDYQHWAILIEQVGVMDGTSGHQSIVTCLYSYGNCLNDPPGIHNKDFLITTRDGMEGPTFDEEYGLVVRPTASTIRVRGKPVWIETSTYHYETNGIQRVDGNRLYIFELVRMLFIEHREKLLSNRFERSERMWADPPQLLELDQWRHPAISEKPSENECFQMIAKAMVEGKAQLYEAPEVENTHFRHHESFLPYFMWPEDEEE